MLLLSCWYKPNELSKRLAIFYSASLTSGAFGGLLAVRAVLLILYKSLAHVSSFACQGVITQYMNGVGGTPGWQWLFIIEGLVTVVISLVAFFILPGKKRGPSST